MPADIRPVILVVDDDEDERQVVSDVLAKRGFRPVQAADGAQAMELVEAENIDVVLTDLRMPGIDGLGLLDRLRETDRGHVPVIFMTAYGSVNEVVEMVRKGALDVLGKPLDFDGIEATLTRAVRQKRLADEVRLLRGDLEPHRFGPLLGRSGPMRKLFQAIRSVAPTDATVLIEGESGTGKELVARAIHDFSERKHAPFVPLNCSAIPRDLMEAQLFGYRRGAFTGAVKDFRGLFMQADGGTLFFDEISLMHIELQGKLLRAIEHKLVQPIGAAETSAANVRILAATNLPLRQAVASGTFREDLYYRLNVFSVELPPLRDRAEDIPLLVQHFLAAGAAERTIEPAAMAALVEYRWPGNVRELRNQIERAGILCNDGRIGVDDLRFDTLRPGSDHGTVPERQLRPTVTADELPPDAFPFTEFGHALVKAALDKCAGNQSGAARYLGITRKELRTLMKNAGVLDGAP